MNKFYELAEKININIFEEIINKDINQVIKGENSIIIDLQKHYVGNLIINISSIGNHQDSPIYLQVNFYEHECEMNLDVDNYHGWISKSWIQEERIHIDETPFQYNITRRYAFRYIKIKSLSSSSNYEPVINSIIIHSTSSANYINVSNTLLKSLDEKIDKVSLNTLHDCMQEVFEDGPKRDRRLWLGDLRLQALTNYETFKNYDLVKKSLYYFAGSINNNGLISSNIFLKPCICGDHITLIDYSMLFIPSLYEYYNETLDLEFLKLLEPIAYSQFRNVHDILLNKSFDKDTFPFIDWNLKLEKELSMIGVYLYSLNYLAKIEKILNNNIDIIINEITYFKKVALEYYDNSKGLFICNDQISYASQIWMILGDVVDKNIGTSLINNLNKVNSIKMISPYISHYYIEALIKLDLKNEAHEYINYYWGEMIKLNADTFFEIFDISDNETSPYGGKIVESFCHAWSCTPSYFLRKYFNK